MDNVFLTGPTGNPYLVGQASYNLGSWIEKTAGVDYGAGGLVRQVFSTNSFVDGVRFVREDRSGVRTMRFPVIIASGAILDNALNPAHLDYVEGALRLLARPGGYVDVDPAYSMSAGAATYPPIRFDIVGANITHREWSVDLQRIGRRRLMVELQTQPFGYWPTWIDVAVRASISCSGAGAVSGITISGFDEIIGDVPGLCEITIVPTVATQTASHAVLGAGMTPFQVDGVAWSNGGRPSFLAQIAGASLTARDYTNSYDGTLAVGAAPFGATAMFALIPPASAGFGIPFVYNVTPALSPAYRGRFRVFAGLYETAGRQHQVSVDAVSQTPGNTSLSVPLASANQVATIIGSTVNGWGLYDLGEMTLPPGPSGVASGFYLRCFASRASAAATSALYSAGLYLLPLDGEAGVLTRGMAYPSIGVATGNQEQLGVTIRTDLGVFNQGGDLRRYYNGQVPYMGASLLSTGARKIDLLSFQRIPAAASYGGPAFSGTRAFASVSVRYQPRFSFMRYV